jgi:methyltransferase
MTRALILFVLVFAPMLAETRRSRRHERVLRTAGAIEPPQDVYRAMQIAYPASFLAMIAEGCRASRRWRVPAAGLIVFGSGKALKYWAIWTLGPRWTFRVLVPPGAPRLTAGPYRWLRHPNYLGVIGELAGVALLARAPRTGLVSLLVFGGLMVARIAIEERALEARDPAS